MRTGVCAVYLGPIVPASNGHPIVEVSSSRGALRARVPAFLVIIEGLSDIAALVLVANPNVGSLRIFEAIGGQRRTRQHCMRRHGEFRKIGRGIKDCV